MNLNIKRRIVFSGKEYQNVEEMPEAIRQIYEAAIASLGASAGPAGTPESLARTPPADESSDDRPIKPPSGRISWRPVLIPLALLLLAVLVISRVLRPR